MKRREVLTTGLAASAIGLPVVARSQETIEWKLPTSFPPNAPGVGTNVTRFAELVNAMSGGRLTLKVFGPGELVPPFGVEDAVQEGVAEIGHSTPYYAAGKNPAFHYFSAIPFGMTADEHVAWLKWGGGQQLWDEIYAERGLKPFYSGNSGIQSSGWFNKPINSLQDLSGLNMRIAGLGGELYRKLGVNAVLMPPLEIFQALQSGAIDAAEWVGPMLDQAFGLYKLTKHYYLPAFNEPSAALEILVNKAAYDELPEDLQVIIQTSASAAALESLAQFDYYNAQAVAPLKEKGVEFKSFPDDVVDAMRGAWHEVRDELSASSADFKKVRESYEAFLPAAVNYSKIMMLPLLEGREA